MILNINKPKNWTSFDVVAKVRSDLRVNRGIKNIKVGHAGTLDPLAEGVLLVLTDKDTKKQSEFMQLPKEYLAKVAFGASSASYDLETPLNFAPEAPSLEKLREQLPAALKIFIGEIEQTVPPYSAVKVNGKRLYREARKRELAKSELPVKRITIYSIEMISIVEEKISDYEILLPVLTCLVTCSSGTYIRSLAHDLGEQLDTTGVLVALTRTKVGDYTLEDSIPIAEVMQKS